MKVKSFCAMPTSLARDGDLSLNAKGLYLPIKSCSEDPNFFYNHFQPAIEGECKESSDELEKAWEELKKTGYVKLHRVPHDGHGSKECHYEYTLFAADIHSATSPETGIAVSRSIPEVQPIKRT